MCSVMVLEARSPKLRYWQDHVSSEGFREESFCAPSSFQWFLVSLIS